MNQDQLQNGRRQLIPGAPYYIPISIPFTSTLNEAVAAFSFPAQTVGDVEVIGATSDIEHAKVQFSINRKPIWSNEQIPVATMFGRPDSVKPVIWYQRPLRLLQGARIRAELTNTGGEPAGKLIFICRQVDTVMPLQKPLANLQDVGELEVKAIDSQFSGTLNEVTITPSEVLDYDFVLRALHTTLGQANLRVFGLGGRLWMEQPIPIWAIAGKATSAIPNQPMQPSCLIPAGYSIQFEFTNVAAEPSGHIFMVGQRLQ